ncbi:MAG: hypothetical protein ACREQY_13370 [Candidatus Binatia bacterium]
MKRFVNPAQPLTPAILDGSEAVDPRPARELAKRREIIGDFSLNACFRMAGISREDAVHGMRLFAEKVVPALR